MTTQPFPQSTPPKKSSRVFVMLAIGGFVVAIVSFILMQLSFGAADNGHVVFEILGFALFVVWLAAVIGLIVGVIGALVRLRR
jgi:membrane associated rhomboid family serine protease